MAPAPTEPQFPHKPFLKDILIDVEYENVTIEQRSNIRGCLEVTDFYDIHGHHCKDCSNGEPFLDYLHSLVFEDLFYFIGSQGVLRDAATTFDEWCISRRGTRLILVNGEEHTVIVRRKAAKQVKKFVEGLPDTVKQFKIIVYNPLLRHDLGRVIDEDTGHPICSPIFPTMDEVHAMPYSAHSPYSLPSDLSTSSSPNMATRPSESPVPVKSTMAPAPQDAPADALGTTSAATGMPFAASPCLPTVVDGSYVPLEMGEATESVTSVSSPFLSCTRCACCQTTQLCACVLPLLHDAPMVSTGPSLGFDCLVLSALPDSTSIPDCPTSPSHSGTSQVHTTQTQLHHAATSPSPCCLAAIPTNIAPIETQLVPLSMDASLLVHEDDSGLCTAYEQWLGHSEYRHLQSLYIYVDGIPAGCHNSNPVCAWPSCLANLPFSLPRPPECCTLDDSRAQSHSTATSGCVALIVPLLDADDPSQQPYSSAGENSRGTIRSGSYLRLSSSLEHAGIMADAPKPIASPECSADIMWFSLPHPPDAVPVVAAQSYLEALSFSLPRSPTYGLLIPAIEACRAQVHSGCVVASIGNSQAWFHPPKVIVPVLDAAGPMYRPYSSAGEDSRVTIGSGSSGPKYCRDILLFALPRPPDAVSAATAQLHFPETLSPSLRHRLPDCATRSPNVWLPFLPPRPAGTTVTACLFDCHMVLFWSHCGLLLNSRTAAAPGVPFRPYKDLPPSALPRPPEYRLAPAAQFHMSDEVLPPAFLPCHLGTTMTTMIVARLFDCRVGLFWSSTTC
jgi:hypothetical protein